MIGAILGIVLGFLIGFLYFGLFLPWAIWYQDDPLDAVGAVLGIACAGLFVGLLYTVYRVAFEPAILRVSGARRMSRREERLLLPIARECARRLGLPNHPPILIDDTREVNAYAYTRHIVLTQGLLDEVNYDVEAISAVVCHELVHWRNGDPISTAFLQGVALPVYLVHAAAGWLLLQVKAPLARFLVWMVVWPFMLTVNYRRPAGH